MPRTDLTKTTVPGPSPTAGVAVTMTAADTGNSNQFRWTGKEVLIIQNTHASTGYTYTITSIADPYGRTLDITTQAIVAGAIHVIGPLADVAWKQADNQIYLAANNAAVKFGVLQLP